MLRFNLRTSIVFLSLVCLVPLCTTGCWLITDPTAGAQQQILGGDAVSGCTALPSTINSNTMLMPGCYIADQTVTVTGAVLNIEPGVTITFETGAGLTILSDGGIVARGTAAAPITMTGQLGVPGAWNGLLVSSSGVSSNSLEYVTIEYAGGYDYFGWARARANLVLSGTSTTPTSISVTNCTLRNSAGNGFFTDANVVVDDFSNNVITGNATGAGYTAASVAGFLDKTSTFSGNDNDRVRLDGDNVSAVQTWPAIDVPYVITETVTVSSWLTIEPGATLQFQSSTGMTVLSAGSLSAIGNATNPITFTGEVPVRGHWNGLWFSSTNAPTNQLHYVTIEYAGGYKFFGWDTARTNLVLKGATANVTNCTLQHSEGWGAWISSDSVVNADLETSNTYADNVAGDVYREP